jgi:hypothetical protein
MVGALNARDIPTAGSILEHFNRDLVHKVRRSQACMHACMAPAGTHTSVKAHPYAHGLPLSLGHPFVLRLSWHMS